VSAPPDVAALARAVLAAERRIRPFIRETYVEHSPVLSELTGGQIYLKLENLQLTGSFKIRGAFNKLLGLPAEVRARGVVTASTGNHGLAVTHVLQHLQLDGTIFVPTTAAPGKVARMRRAGVRMELATADCAGAEAAARAHAAAHALCYVSPYNDADVVAGQGTLGVELARQIADLDAVFIAVGGGGLVAGVAAHLKSQRPGLRVIGCQPFNSRVMMESIRAGKILELDSQPTLSDGTAGGIEPGSITFPLCRALVDEFVAVTEDEIRSNLRLILDEHHTLIEGAAAVAVAGLLRCREAVRGRTAVVVLCGGNIGLDTLAGREPA
jgi:threonine dehydratase